jgi:hypothetical protein
MVLRQSAIQPAVISPRQASPGFRGSWLLATVPVALLGWALSNPAFRDAEGAWTTAVCLPVSIAAGLIVAITTFFSRMRVAGLWFSLAIVGQSCALQLIDAGRHIHYQHLLPLATLLRDRPFLLAICAVQALAALVALARSRVVIRQWLVERFGAWKLLLVLALISGGAAALSRDIPQYFEELALASCLQAVQVANAILIGLALPPDTWKRLWARLETRGFATAAAVWVFGASAVLAVVSYQLHPHLEDEVVYLLHARYFAAGKLTLPAPPVPKAFEMYLMEVAGGRWFPSPPPGWPLLLAAGILAGAPYLVNPLLAGLNVFLTWLLLRDLYGRRTAALGVLLLAISPWHLFLSMSLMTDVATMTCTLAAALAVIRARESGNVGWALLAGAAIGVSSLIRPLQGFITAILFGLWAIGLGGRRLRLPALAGLVLATALTGAAVFPYNRYLTGKSSQFPIVAYTDKHFGKNSNAYGFGPDRGQGWPLDPFPGHGPRDAAVNSALNIFSLNTELFGWGMGSLALAAMAVLSGKLHPSDRLMLAMIAAVFVAHIFYWYSGGPDFGARYWFAMLVPLVALTVRGAHFLDGPSNGRAAAVVVLLSAATLINYVPWRAIDKYFHYLNMRPDVRLLAREHQFGRSLVLVRGERFPDYASAAVYNPLDVHADAPIYVWDASPEVRREILDAYPDRLVWIVDGPTRTGSGFAVVAGPVEHASVP